MDNTILKHIESDTLRKLIKDSKERLIGNCDNQQYLIQQGEKIKAWTAELLRRGEQI